MSKIEYANQDIIDNADRVAQEIIKEDRKNKHRDKFYPELINRLNLRVGAEIGVDKAGFSGHILSKTKMEKYFCVDTWQDNFGSDYKPEYFDPEGDVRYNEARETLRPYLGDYDKPWEDAGRAVMIRMPSVKASETIMDSTLDFLYIDGDHSLEGIFYDIYTWMPKVKLGGIVSGHDYKDGPKSGINDFWGKQLDFKVKTVVDYYCQRYGYKLNTSGGVVLNWWFVKNRS